MFQEIDTIGGLVAILKDFSKNERREQQTGGLRCVKIDCAGLTIGEPGTKNERETSKKKDLIS